jgi:hypothetical protein
MRKGQSGMKNGLPAYAPLAEPFRCPGCGRRYLVWSGAGDRARAQREAAALGAQLIDVREQPFTYCACGEYLDLTESAAELVM